VALTAASSIAADELAQALRSPVPLDALGDPGNPLVRVALTDQGVPADLDEIDQRRRSLPCVLVGIGDPRAKVASLVDVVAIDERELAPIIETVHTNPRASTAVLSSRAGWRHDPPRVARSMIVRQCASRASMTACRSCCHARRCTTPSARA
jgi:hypothetical protein